MRRSVEFLTTLFSLPIRRNIFITKPQINPPSCKISLNCESDISPAATFAGTPSTPLLAQWQERSATRKRHRETGGVHGKGQMSWCTSGAQSIIWAFQVTYMLGAQTINIPVV